MLELVRSGAEDMMPFMMNKLTMDLWSVKKDPPWRLWTKNVKNFNSELKGGQEIIINSLQKDYDWTFHAEKAWQGTDVRVLGKAKSPNPCFEYNLANLCRVCRVSTLSPLPLLLRYTISD